MRGGDKSEDTLCDVCGRELADAKRIMCDDCKSKIWRAVYGTENHDKTEQFKEESD